MLASGGYYTSLTFTGNRVARGAMLTGLMVFAALVGFFNESFSDTVDNLNRGLPLLPRAATRSFWGGTNATCESSARVLLCDLLAE